MKKKRSFLELAQARKSVHEFTDQNVKEGDLKKIFEAARLSPSANNSQQWSFIVIKNKKTIESLMNSCHYGFFHTAPPLLVAVVLEPLDKHFQGMLKHQAKEVTEYHHYLNISQPVAAMVYEAEDLGIGSCILSPIMEITNKLLKVPQGKTIPLLVGFGYEKKGAFQLNLRRKNMKNLLFSENYGGKR